MAVKIGDPAALTSLGAPSSSLQQGPGLSDGTSAWGVHTGIYVVPAGQTLTRFWFESVSSGAGDNSYGNFLDGITFTPYNCSSETPTYAPPTIAPTSDGFTFQLTNYDATGMTATATVGRASISPTGLVTLTEVPAGTAASVKITNHHDGFVDASVSVDANSLGSALVPKFDTPIEITDGFTAQITNYNATYNWAVSTTDSSSATISSSGLVTVTDNPTTNTVVPVTTSKASHLSGSSFVKITSVKLPTVVFVPVVVPPSSCYSEPAPVQIVPKPVAAVRKPVTISIGGFKDGSSVLTSEIKNKIKKFITKYNDYKVISITGFTEGPTVLKRDRALSRMRAANALGYVKQGSIAKFDYSNIRASQEKTLGSKIRRIQITLQD
jgi:outer membrane protein OmpA-like peptidoglycan-associated protein